MYFDSLGAIGTCILFCNSRYLLRQWLAIVLKTTGIIGHMFDGFFFFFCFVFFLVFFFFFLFCFFSASSSFQFNSFNPTDLNHILALRKHAYSNILKISPLKTFIYKHTMQRRRKDGKMAVIWYIARIVVNSHEAHDFYYYLKKQLSMFNWLTKNRLLA